MRRQSAARLVAHHSGREPLPACTCREQPPSSAHATSRARGSSPDPPRSGHFPPGPPAPARARAHAVAAWPPGVAPRWRAPTTTAAVHRPPPRRRAATPTQRAATGDCMGVHSSSSRRPQRLAVPRSAREQEHVGTRGAAAGRAPIYLVFGRFFVSERSKFHFHYSAAVRGTAPTYLARMANPDLRF